MLAIHTAALRYALRTPSGSPPGGGWPLLCFLHGYGESAPMPIRAALTLHGPLAPQAALIARTGFVLVAPQLPARDVQWAAVARNVEGVVHDARRRSAIDPARQYLTGFSRGGEGVFALAVSQPEWAALWAVDPPRVPAAAPSQPIWLSAGSASRPAAPEFIERLRLEPLHGAVPGQHVFVDAGLDHVGTARFAYEQTQTYAWLLSYRAPAFPAPDAIA